MKAYKMQLPENMEERQVMSRRVQEHAFEMGWFVETTKGPSVKPMALDRKFLYFSKYGDITYGNEKYYFDVNSSNFEEINSEAFLSLPIPSTDFMSDFEAGRYVVGNFWDDGDVHKAIGILEFVTTIRTRAGNETKIYCTEAIKCQNFEYLRTFYDQEEAEKFIRECLGI